MSFFEIFPKLLKITLPADLAAIIVVFKNSDWSF
jgi:hypothetical protein